MTARKWKNRNFETKEKANSKRKQPNVSVSLERSPFAMSFSCPFLPTFRFPVYTSCSRFLARSPNEKKGEREREREMSWASSTSSSFLVCGNGLWQCREVASGCDWEKEERSLFLSYPILEDRRPRVLREREGRIFSLLFGVVFTDFCSSFFPPSSSPSFSFFPQKV